MSYGTTAEYVVACRPADGASGHHSTTYLGLATNAAFSAATRSATTAQIVKDSFFSIFGGGAERPERKGCKGERGKEQDRSG